MKDAAKLRDMTPFEGMDFETLLSTSLDGVGLEPGGLSAALIDTPLQPMVVVADDDALQVLEFLDRRIFGAQVSAVMRATGQGLAVGETRVTAQIREELDAYFRGVLARFRTPLALHGTPFVTAVWRALLAVPVGETRSYGALAETLRNPKAVRAVAQANGANRLAIIVPCHRILGADGSLTGYGGGLWRKKWLLEHEGRHFGNRLL